jgi:hypothetical protein
LRLDRNRRAAAPQFAQVGIKRMIRKKELHRDPPKNAFSIKNQTHLRQK